MGFPLNGERCLLMIRHFFYLLGEKPKTLRVSLIMFVLDYLAGEKPKNFSRHGEVNSTVKGIFFLIFHQTSLLVQIYEGEQNAHPCLILQIRWNCSNVFHFPISLPWVTFLYFPCTQLLPPCLFVFFNKMFQCLSNK